MTSKAGKCKSEYLIGRQGWEYSILFILQRQYFCKTKISKKMSHLVFNVVVPKRPKGHKSHAQSKRAQDKQINRQPDIGLQSDKRKQEPNKTK